ncbi:spore germination protein [Clostridium hydrogeniformans]|uniref:spore germination protein n=1 Tax=Clostridium hydrogeniformans TaxID=349933 RepID=UPI000488FBD5|nr:spore germination protein [Clostridium hydrogeniformans]
MKENLKETIDESLEENLKYIKDLLKNDSDVVYREFSIGYKKVALIYIDGLSDKDLINDFVIENLMHHSTQVLSVDVLLERVIALSDIRKIESLKDGINAFLSGDPLLLFDKETKGCVLSLRAWANRGVGEPAGEVVVKGPRDGLTEIIRFNTALIRRRIRDTRFKIASKVIGERSKTDCAVLYIEDIVNQNVLDDVNKRLDKIQIDAVLDSGYIEQLIEDDNFSIFPQVQVTERPDVVAAALYEGRVAILVDNSPFALIVPTTLPLLFQSPDDYYQRWIYASGVRIIRFLAVILSLVTPALYVAITSFHTSIIPTKLAYSIAASRNGVPFPAFIEAIIMEVSFALLMESIVRLPRAIGATIGIVGGLIIGQAAVSAGIVSPIMVIIVSLTAITSFVTPNYEVTFAFRIIRFITIIASAIIGLYGIAIVMIILVIHLIKLRSFGVSYLSPVADMDKEDFKDTFLRFPLKFFKRRPKFMNTGDKIRQK